MFGIQAQGRPSSWILNSLFTFLPRVPNIFPRREQNRGSAEINAEHTSAAECAVDTRQNMFRLTITPDVLWNSE
jgi:hypothetical protein